MSDLPLLDYIEAARRAEEGAASAKWRLSK